MAFSSWSLGIPALLIFVCMVKSPLHASASLIGAILWYTIFPPGTANDRKHLPSRVTYLASLQVEADTSEESIKEICSTCWHEIEAPIRLVCGHRFCKGCILPWFSAASAVGSCPICKRDLFVAENTLSTRDSINQLAHKLRVCAAIVLIITTLLKTIPCSWVLHGWHSSLMPLFRCTTGGMSLWNCFEEIVYIVLSILMVTTANRSFWTHGQDWHRAHLGGVFNIAATIGWLSHCSSELDTLSALSSLALRRRS
jgi:hypothetical protein